MPFQDTFFPETHVHLVSRGPAVYKEMNIFTLQLLLISLRELVLN